MPDMWMNVDTAVAIPVNKVPLVDATDFKTREVALDSTSSGLSLEWHFVSTSGWAASTAITPAASACAHAFVHASGGIYTCAMPASACAINNDTEGFGWFTGSATACLPFAGPTVGFRSSPLNDALVDTDNLFDASSNIKVNVEGNISGAVNTVSCGVTASTVACGVTLSCGVTVNTIGASAISAAAISACGAEKVADYVWDEVLTGATHNVVNSAGRKLRAIAGGSELHAGQCAASAGVNFAYLDSSASTTLGLYDPGLMIIDGGTGVGQCRRILDYNGSAKQVWVNRDWRIPPDTTSTYIIVGEGGELDCNEGRLAAATSDTVTLNVHAVAVSGTYVGETIALVAGTGKGQSRIITDYDGSSKIATVHEAWSTTPDVNTSYYMVPVGRSSVIDMDGTITDEIADAVRVEMDASSTQLTTIAADVDGLNGSAIVSAVSVRQEMDSSSTKLTTIAADVDGLNGSGFSSVTLACGVTVNVLADDAITASAFSASAVAEIADGVWDEATSGHTTSGSTGAALTAATAPSAATVADAVWNETMADHLTAGSTGYKLNSAAAAAGAGAITWTYDVTRSDTGAAIPNCEVWVTSDSAGTNILASGTTNSAGRVTFTLDAGAVYVWRSCPGYNFTNPDSETVS